MISISDAIDAFTASYCLHRSAVYPYVVDRHASLVVMHDEPDRPNRRNSEVIVLPGASPHDTVRQVADLCLPGRLTLSPICDLSQDPRVLAGQYKALGYRLGRTEPLMAFDLSRRIPKADEHPIHRVKSEADAAAVKRLTKRRVHDDNLCATPGARVRTYYCALPSGDAAGYCRAIVSHPAAAYVDGVFTAPEHRRKRIGTSLLAAMLADDAADGQRFSVLLATSAGTKLYESVGYEQIASLIVMTPKR